MKVIKGDLVKLALEGQFDVIVHGCNCFCTMGSGIARQIRETWPMAYEEDMKTVKGNCDKLGTCSIYKTASGLYIFNAYTQYGYGKGIKHTDYLAIKECFKDISNRVRGGLPRARIAYPKIGAGLGGGDWNIISKIIDKELDGLDHTLVEYEP